MDYSAEQWYVTRLYNNWKARVGKHFSTRQVGKPAQNASSKLGLQQHKEHLRSKLSNLPVHYGAEYGRTAAAK